MPSGFLGEREAVEKKKPHTEGFLLDFGSSMCYGILLLEPTLRCAEEGALRAFSISVLLTFWASSLLVLQAHLCIVGCLAASLTLTH